MAGLLALLAFCRFSPPATVAYSFALASSQVIGEAQGDESSLKEFIDHLHQGPPASRVAAVNHKQIDLKQYETGFGVHR